MPERLLRVKLNAIARRHSLRHTVYIHTTQSPTAQTVRITNEHSIRFIRAHVSGYTQTAKPAVYEVLHDGYLVKSVSSEKEAVDFVNMQLVDELLPA